MTLIKYALLISIILTQVSTVKSETTPDQSDTKPVLTVTVTSPEFQTVGQRIEANGNIDAREIATVTAQVSGLSLNKILVDVGDTIQKGQLLATYDASMVRNDIASAKASLKRAEIAREQASTNAKRAKTLRKSKAISSLEYDNYIYQEKLARAQVDSAKAVLDNQNLRNSYSNVKAKFGGLISDKQAVLGAIGNPGTPLFSVIVNGELEWQANVPSEQLSKITPQMPVTVTILAENTGGAEPIEVMGKVRKIDPTVDSQTRLGKVYVSLDKHDSLRRGLFVRGKFTLGDTSALTIPANCLMRKDGYNYVFILGNDKRVLRKKVTVGQLSGTDLTITKGLSKDDKVISSGIGFLNNGDLVNVAE